MADVEIDVVQPPFLHFKVNSASHDVTRCKVSAIIVREHGGVLHEVTVLPDGFLWRGETWASLSAIALRITGTNWNGFRFFGLREKSRRTA